MHANIHLELGNQGLMSVDERGVEVTVDDAGCWRRHCACSEAVPVRTVPERFVERRRHGVSKARAKALIKLQHVRHARCRDVLPRSSGEAGKRPAIWSCWASDVPIA